MNTNILNISQNVALFLNESKRNNMKSKLKIRYRNPNHGKPMADFSIENLKNRLFPNIT